MNVAPGEIARRIRAGDRAAEGQLVERFGRQILFLLRSWTRDDATAEDLYQETFRTVLEKVRGGEPRDPEKLGSYLCGLAKNLCTYHYRRGGRRQRYHAEPEAASVVPDPSPGLLGSLLQREKIDLVRRVLDEMPTARDREILGRFYLADDDKAEICDDLDIPEEHFKRVLYRARQRYRELYEARVRSEEAR